MWAYEVELRLHKPSVYSSNFQVLSLQFKFLSFKTDIEIYLGGWYIVYVFGFYGGKNKHLLQHFKQSLTVQNTRLALTSLMRVTISKKKLEDLMLHGRKGTKHLKAVSLLKSC